MATRIGSETSAQSTGVGRAGPAAGLLAWIRTMLARAQQRRELFELDDTLLRDIGINRLEARAEAAKPLWRR